MNRIGLGVAAALLLSGCAHTPETRHHEAVAVLTPPPGGAACIAGLQDRGVVFTEVADFMAPHPCGIDTPVKVTRAEGRLSPPGVMGCALATTLDRFESEVVGPAAQSDLGLSVSGIVNMGAYSCRKQIGSEHSHYVSMHGYGVAIDIGGWTFSDGSDVLFGRDWSGADPARRRFLRDVSSRACHYFSVVLTPASNAAHHNHMHVDIGPYRYCGAGHEHS